jgi:hypothetical protein
VLDGARTSLLQAVSLFKIARTGARAVITDLK